MPTIAEWITELAKDETVDALILGDMGWAGYGHEHIENYSSQPKGKILTWDEAQPYINYEFDDGFGAPRCNSFIAYTKSWIISVSQYDGSTSPFCLPRNPIECMPEMPGG